MTQNLEPVEQRLATMEQAFHRSRRTNIAWFLGGTMLLVIFIVILADIGSGLIDARARLDGLEKQIEQVNTDG